MSIPFNPAAHTAVENHDINRVGTKKKAWRLRQLQRKITYS